MAQRRGAGAAGPLLPALPRRHHRGHHPGGAVPLRTGDAHAPRHADPRRRLQPRDGGRARHQHQAALHVRVRPRRGAGRLRRPDAGSDSHRADRHGREHPDRRLRGHRHRRDRLDPRRLRRLAVRRHGRHHRPRVLSRPAAAGAEQGGRRHGGAGPVLDDDLPPDGGRAGAAAGGPVPGSEPMTPMVNARNLVVAALLAFLLLLPVYTGVTGNPFLLTLFTRIVILALAATSLNFIIGLFCLRTRGVYFIMITLAFAQMVYYVAAGLARYGGDDGLTIYRRSQFDGLNLSNKPTFYYLCLALLLGTIFLVWRLVNSRFGLVIQGARSNERRMQSIGFPNFCYRLTCFVNAGTLCGLAGALLANHTDFVSPAMMYWTRSGALIVMVVLGGMSSTFGPLIGAVALLVLEEALSGLTEYWQIILGPLLLLVVLFARGGIDGLLEAASLRPRLGGGADAKVRRG